LKETFTALFITLLTSVCLATTAKDNLVSVQRSIIHWSVVPRIQQVWGSGICIDQPCSVVATAYHTQMLVGRANLEVAGSSTKEVLSPENQGDTNKADIRIGKLTLSYDTESDVVFVYTKKPVSHKSGISHTYVYHVGQTVEIAGYNHKRFETKEAHIIGVNVPIVMGQARLKQNLILDIPLKPGDSGSAVLDEHGNLIGMITLTGSLKFNGGDLTASVALPVAVIARTLQQLDPELGRAMFGNVPEAEPTFAQAQLVADQEIDLPDDASRVIPELTATSVQLPDPVETLRKKADAASRSMVNIIAKQCLVQRGEKPICHALSVRDGEQAFQEIGRNGKPGRLMDSFPVQTHGVWPQTDWLDTLRGVADHPWTFEGRAGDHYLFAFKSEANDARCDYEEYPQPGIPLFKGGHQSWNGSVACFEQVLTDKDFNVLVVFTERIPPSNCLVESIQTVIYYDWTKLEGRPLRTLLPVTERITAKVQGQKRLLYAQVSWNDYKQFSAEHRIKF
jgi:hypothetical protein